MPTPPDNGQLELNLEPPPVQTPVVEPQPSNHQDDPDPDEGHYDPWADLGYQPRRRH